MIRSRHFIFVPLFLSAMLATGCGASRPDASAPQTTGGTYTGANEQGPVVTTGGQTPEQRERAAIAAGADTPATRDALELRVVTALEGADVQLDGLRTRLQGTTEATERQLIEKQITHGQDYKVRLYGHLKQLHGATTQPWNIFQKDVEATIADLTQALGNQRQKPNLPPSAQPTQPPKTH